ncbi:MAG: hypothetical protein NVSMB53_19900 [Gemmatimonadaceae bacterium]
MRWTYFTDHEGHIITRVNRFTDQTERLIVTSSSWTRVSPAAVPTPASSPADTGYDALLRRYLPKPTTK